MEKIISLTLTLVCLFSLSVMVQAQSKIIKKNISKVIRPEIAPEPAPIKLSTPEAVPMPEPPLPPIETQKQDKGLLGWNSRADVSGLYLLNSGQKGLLGLIGAGANLIIDDPAKIGANLGLAEDALEYRVGTGLYLGQDKNDQSMFSIPLKADATLYLKEGSLFGLDPFIGTGINFNLLGTDTTIGGMGGEIFGGVLANLGWGTGPAEIIVSYGSKRVGSIRDAEGLGFSLAQPIKL